MKCIFDIGMFDGSDTAHQLDMGHRVVAIEANPDLVADARQRFSTHIDAGRLTCVHAAISPDGQPVELTLSGHDPGSSSLFSERVAGKRPIGAVKVPGVTLGQLFTEHGCPEYLKVDIEGADRMCVLALTEETRPPFLSFEVGDDADELLAHAERVGYRRFKVINQISFRELANERLLWDRIAHRAMRYLGYREPRYVRRAGSFFVSGHSSGPVPWASDGRWYSAEATRTRLRDASRAGTLSGWYYIHASA